MAKTLYTGSVEVTAQNGSSGLMAYKFDAEIIENSTSTSQNKSNITCNMYATGQHGWYYEGHTGPEAFINVQGERKATVSVPNIYLSRQLICSWTGDVAHNSDGTKNIRVTFNYASNISVSYMPNNAKITADPVALTPIPRYADINSFTVSKRDETSLKLDFTANATCDYAWYRYKLSTASSYGSWTGVDIADAKNGSFNITGLSANSTYDVQLRVRRKDSQLTTDSNPVSQTTYDYPKVADNGISANPLIIGNQQTLTLDNPLGRAVTVKMYKDNTSGTQLYSGTTSGTTIQFTPNTATLYNSIPNNQEGNCVYSVIYGNSTKTTAVNKYKIKGDEYPTFSANDWNYVADKIGLTNNNKTVINKYSNVTVNVNNPATSEYGSSINKYVITWGNAPSQEISQGTGTISGGDTNTITVTAYDTRGLPKATSKTFEEFVEYTDLNINEISADRENGIEAGVKLSFRGQMYNGKFGTNGVNNALSSAKYYVSTNGTIWSGPYPNDNSMLNAIVKNDNYISLSVFTIHANGSSGGFTVGQQYYVRVEIKDGQNLLSSTQSISIVADGKIARAVYQGSNGDYHEGINGLPDSRYNQNIHGSLNVTDNIFINDVPLTDVQSNDKTIYANDFKSKNKYNSNTDKLNYVLSSDGTETATNGFLISDFIPVEPSTQYTISRVYNSGSGGDNYMRVGFYGNDKSFISRPSSKNNPYTLTTPNNCYYVKISYAYVNSNVVVNSNVQLELGEATTYTPYFNLIKEENGYVKENTTFYADDFKCRNLFNKDNQNLVSITSQNVKRYGIEIKADGQLVSISGSSWGGPLYYKLKSGNTYGSYVEMRQNTTVMVPDTIVIYCGTENYLLTDMVTNIQVEFGEITPYTPYKRYGIEETGWKTLTGFGIYKKIDDMVYIRADINGLSLSIPANSYTTIGTLPAELAPLRTVRKNMVIVLLGGAYNTYYCFLLIATSGEVRIYNITSSAISIYGYNINEQYTIR